MRIDNILITYDNDFFHALEVIDKSGMGMAIIIDKDGRFIRTVTDGDIRRLMLNHNKKDKDLHSLQGIQSIYATENESNSALIEKMRANDIQQLPILDSEFRPVDVVLRKNIEFPI